MTTTLDPAVTGSLADSTWTECSVESTVDRLYLEFGGKLERTVVAAVVRQCVQDLDSAPAGALPELSERLARQRLLG
ncbi:hypothetical protein [Nocardia jejuensis]|uniref:hypothetical protein n=1 Tax=Nocardia jejuensis TaxID=328049 RepID=UPI00083709C0|nr:hypothetical protein [Nocardia jejuensis]